MLHIKAVAIVSQATPMRMCLVRLTSSLCGLAMSGRIMLNYALETSINRPLAVPTCGNHTEVKDCLGPDPKLLETVQPCTTEMQIA